MGVSISCRYIPVVYNNVACARILELDDLRIAKYTVARSIPTLSRTSASMEKIKVVLHEAETPVVKLWRFDSCKVADYTRKEVECSMISLFPDIEKKGTH